MGDHPDHDQPFKFREFRGFNCFFKVETRPRQAPPNPGFKKCNKTKNKHQKGEEKQKYKNQKVNIYNELENIKKDYMKSKK